MTERTASRRNFLGSVGAGVVGVFGTGGFGGRTGEPVRRYSVGTASRDVTGVARERAENVGRVLDFSAIGTAVVGEFTEGAATALEDRDDVRYVQQAVELELVSSAQSDQASPWGVDRIDADVAHANGETGEGVHVAVLDSGIAAGHPDLWRNLGDGRAFVDCVSGAVLRCTWNPFEGKSECEVRPRRCAQAWGDDVPGGGHGTHVAGIIGATDNDRGILGIAPDATLHSVKVVNAFGTGTDADIAAGVKHAADREWDVVNLSLGELRQSRVLGDALDYAAERGVVLVAAAGNLGPARRSVGFPARHPAVIAVSATTRGDRLASFSSRGGTVDIAAPGADVCSTVRGGAQSSLSGTSMASPHVAGAASLLLGSGVSPDEVRGRLAESAEDIGLPATRQGAGLVDAAAALGLDSDDDGSGDGVCNPPTTAETG